MRTTIAALLVALAPSLALGQALTDCPGEAPGAGDIISSQSARCYDFTGTTDSALFAVTARTATVCLDPDVAGTGGTATVTLRGPCLGSTASVNTCDPLYTDQDGDGAIDASPLDGNAATGSRCIYKVPPGLYYIDVVASAGGSTARVRIKGD